MYHKSLHKQKEKGQGLVEYALILVLVAIVVIAALMILGPIIGNVFSKVNSSLSGIGAASAAAPLGPYFHDAPCHIPPEIESNGKCYLP
jgi:pilus assembly protein Flp/PilA